MVQTLCFMTPSQLELMETRREVILSAASELEAFETPSLSDDGLHILRELTIRLTSLHDVCAFFDAGTSSTVRGIMSANTAIASRAGLKFGRVP